MTLHEPRWVTAAMVGVYGALVKMTATILSRRLGHEIGEIRRDKLSAHEDMQARLGRLEDDSRRARGTDTEE